MTVLKFVILLTIAIIVINELFIVNKREFVELALIYLIFILRGFVISTLTHILAQLSEKLLMLQHQLITLPICFNNF